MNKNDLQQLIDNPRESLSVELKRWIDPATPEGMAKIVKAALAFRNYNGGCLIIGFKNDPVEPDTENVPQDTAAAFHLDKIQGGIAKYSSQPFEIEVELV
jgi:predicted HTH transcriptional regulator